VSDTRTFLRVRLVQCQVGERGWPWQSQTEGDLGVGVETREATQYYRVQEGRKGRKNTLRSSRSKIMISPFCSEIRPYLVHLLTTINPYIAHLTFSIWTRVELWTHVQIRPDQYIPNYCLSTLSMDNRIH
jgi:hypothetical protein